MKGRAAITLAFACSFSGTLAGIMFLFAASEVMAAQNQTSDFEHELAAGKLAAGQSHYIEAAEHFIKANELRNGKCSECYVWLARMDLGLGVLKPALAQTDKAVAMAASASELANAQLYRGVVLGRQRNFPAAETAFRAASAADRTCVECKFNLGFVLLKESKDAEGIAVLGALAPALAGTARGDEIERFIKDPSLVHKNYAPEFSAKSRTGEEVNLNTLKGKVVLLDFWGAWCTPCRVSLPQLKDLASRVDPTKVAIVSVDEYDPRATWEQYVQANGMNWVQVYDGDRALHNAFSVDGFPRYFILSKSGIILAEFKGWNQDGESTISNAINSALNARD